MNRKTKIPSGPGVICITLIILTFVITCSAQGAATDCYPPRPIPVDRWRGEYFNNKELKGSPQLVRDDGSSDIRFDWGLNGPSDECRMKKDEFSVRWTRRIAFAGGKFRFKILSDDGVRLFIDGKESFSLWQDNPPTTSIVDVNLTPGNHVVVLEYYENYGSALVELQWDRHPCDENVPVDHWRGEYFNNTELNGEPVRARNEGTDFISFNRKSDKPDKNCGLNKNSFSARWSRKIILGPGRYRFNLKANGGARLQVNGQKIIDRWQPAGISTSAEIYLKPGSHSVVLEYFNKTGDAIVTLNWVFAGGGQN